jgi:hypothetical protein
MSSKQEVTVAHFIPQALPTTNAKDLARFMTKLVVTDGCWQWKGPAGPNGYASFHLHGSTSAHRAAWILFRGPIPSGMFVCHGCDNRTCANPNHLWLGTHADNMADMVQKGRHDRTKCEPKNRARGERQGSAKITEPIVREMRTLFASGAQQKDIAKKFGVSIPTVSAACTKRTWAHVI